MPTSTKKQPRKHIITVCHPNCNWNKNIKWQLFGICLNYDHCDHYIIHQLLIAYWKAYIYSRFEEFYLYLFDSHDLHLGEKRVIHIYKVFPNLYAKENRTQIFIWNNIFKWYKYLKNNAMYPNLFTNYLYIYWNRWIWANKTKFWRCSEYKHEPLVQHYHTKSADNQLRLCDSHRRWRTDVKHR